MTMLARRIVLIALLLAPAAAAGAQARQAVFSLSIAGIPAGRLTLESEREGNAYSAAARVEATGLLGVLADFGYHGTSSGRIDAGTVVPDRFVADSRSPRGARHTEVDWKDGTPARVSVEPPRDTAPDPAAQGGTLDPVSAGFALLGDTPPERLCNAAVDLYDGSRRSRLVLAEPVAEEGGYVCAGSYARVEGEEHSMSDQRSFPFRLMFRPTGEGLVALDRIEAPTRFGQAVLERRE